MRAYDELIASTKEIFRKDRNVRGEILFGSRARTSMPSDEYSDCDLMIFTETPDDYLESDAWLKDIGKPYISFLEPSVMGLHERRMLFDGSMDLDLLVIPSSRMAEALANSEIQLFLNRGFRILLDKDGLLSNIAPEIRTGIAMDSREFNNAVNAFWFHAVWALKKYLRGERFIARRCCDEYMKELLMRILELRLNSETGADTWHDGRFFERWEDTETVKAFEACYSDCGGIPLAIWRMMELFGGEARKAAGYLNYTYPYEAEMYAKRRVKRYIDGLAVNKEQYHLESL